MHQNNATIVALAWPDTKVTHEGKWYDYPMKWLGIIDKEGYYSAGHAALLLINHTNGDVHYFDFGRYHTPIKHGRVRDKETDPDVEIPIKAIIKNNHISNIEELLLERYNNKACHGVGRLTASFVHHVDFEKAYQKAKEMQAREAIKYGPFQPNGTNCSRLVVQVVYASSNNWLNKLLIKVPYTVSATPRSNNKVLNDCPFYYEVNNHQVSIKKSKLYAFKRMLVCKLQDNHFTELPQQAPNKAFSTTNHLPTN